MNSVFNVLEKWFVIGVWVCLVAGSAWGNECGAVFSRWQADNREFYDGLSLATFCQRRDQCGLTFSPDLRHPAVMALLERQDRVSGSILEIGGGFGRVVDVLLQDTPISRIEVIEHSNANMRILRGRFGGESRVRLYHQSVVEPIPGLKVNGALWMWAGFFELAPQDKAVALKNVYEQLNDGGFLIIDIPPGVDQLGTSAMLVAAGGSFLDFKLGDVNSERTIHLHFMSAPAIVEAASKVGLIHVNSVYYIVLATGISARTLLIFVKE